MSDATARPTDIRSARSESLFVRNLLLFATSKLSLISAVVVLGFLTIDTDAALPLLYLRTALQVVVGAVFDTARDASLPNITRRRELLTANALGAATWSTMLALGAASGGVATE